jgi:hypothetical protein
MNATERQGGEGSKSLASQFFGDAFNNLKDKYSGYYTFRGGRDQENCGSMPVDFKHSVSP